jgi:alkanesulfonate monooxygenase SsuD/methylene tetrahydromethanopterin reductase-like flavin-dependent oxidoreductase (luciferase family)
VGASPRPILFGISVAPLADRYEENLRLVHVADDLGLDLVGIQDHPYQRRFLDTWTLISAYAVQTRRIRFFPDVANLPLRPPAVLAKAAASLDVITGGRVELGIGAGGFWDAVEAMGGSRRSPGESVAALEEAIEVIRLMWAASDRGVRFDGRYYRLAGVKPGPAPAHPIGIWVGAYGPRMLALVGRKADGWIPSAGRVPFEWFREAVARITEAATDAGRDPWDVRRLVNIGAVFRRGGSAIEPQAWTQELLRYVEIGMNGFVFWPGDAPNPEELLRIFAQEVVPAVRTG